ncbi:MAG: hypothetical protein AAB842_02810 [Patescibacteria group bacterium]
MPAKKVVVKKLVKKSITKPSFAPAELRRAKEIGKVLHYFNNIKVAVIKFKEPVKVGDTIKITGGEGIDFKQKIASMQIEHKKVALVKKGQEVGIKLKEKVREGYKVFKL